jgi:hypothetical protein
MLEKPLKLFMCDLNWTYFDKPFVHTPPSAPHDWAFVDPQAYFDWHRDFGNNMTFCQAYTFCGYAFYPSRLGPVAPGPGQELVPRLFDLSRQAGLPFCTYFCVGADLIMSNLRDQWVVPTSRAEAYHGFLAPESPWTDLLCARIEEFLRVYPVEWILFDWFIYGSLRPDRFRVQPAWFVEQPFREIIGRDMPGNAADIAPEESLAYKREILARQFRRIQDVIRRTSPATRITFNVPYWEADEAIWHNHLMLNESDGLLAESTNDDVLNWLLRIRKPEQRVFTTVIGRMDGVCDPNSWRYWRERGCDFMGYAWGTPPDFRPHPSYSAGLDIVRRAFREM